MTAEHVDKPRILIVEDNPANVDVLIDQLASAGFTIAVAEDGEGALERCQYKAPDLILLDVILPGIDGFETCRRLKANHRTQSIPVIFMSALTDLADKMRGFAVGGVDFVTKPVQEQEVLARVKTHLALRRMQQQIEAQNAQLQQEIAVRQQVEADLQRAGRSTASNASAGQPMAAPCRSRFGPARLSTLGCRGLLLHVRDITERKQLEAQLVQAQKMESIGRLASGVAHDFNNLLMVIGGYANLALDQLVPTDPLYDDLYEVRTIVERAARLTHQLLAFARQQIIEPQILNLNDQIRDLGKLLRHLIGEEIELVSKLAPDLAGIKADPSQIEQLLVNLVVNARDAMPKGGMVQIETHNIELEHASVQRDASITLPGAVCLTVTDTGVGMDDVVKRHLFELFYTTKALGQGTGVGLATCYGIIKQHGGHIEVDSEVGQGSTFRIYLPAASHGAA